MAMLIEDGYLFYDIEVFSHDALVVFMDSHKNVVKTFHNDFVGLSDFIKGKTLVGFNNYYYDDKIMIYMLDLKTPKQIKELNDRIIAGDETRYIGKKKFDSLDCFQQIDVSMPSLKKIEGNMGLKILESSVPFDIDRPLTKEEVVEVFDYCQYDVESTIDVFKQRLTSYFQPKFSLVEMLGKPDAIKWNTTTISANLLLKKPLPKWSNIRVEEEMMELVPSEVRELWLEKEKGSVTIQEFDNDIQFAFGGLHGAHKTIKRARDVKLLDVKSMYPHIILILNVLGASSEKYKSILDKRLEVKYINEILSDALKLVLNSVYGNLNSKYSMLYNPKALLSVCVYGQIALYELCRRISPFATILNINTDGIIFEPHDLGYVEAYREWEKEFLLELEEKDFSLFLQKDVNNYIASNEKRLICKGSDVNLYERDAYFRTNNARIVDIALVEHLVYGKDVFETLLENVENPRLFQYILKAGHTYKGTFDVQGNQYNKVNRIFASKNEGFCLFKMRHDEGLVRFADTPVNQFLWNQDCNELDNFSNIVDLNHYYQLVIKRLERWN